MRKRDKITDLLSFQADHFIKQRKRSFLAEGKQAGDKITGAGNLQEQFVKKFTISFLIIRSFH